MSLVMTSNHLLKLPVHLYPHGQCTWYVYHRMNQFDASISGDLGDAHNWNNRAESEGYTVTHTPKKSYCSCV